jgi:photosystem II stability/assembly factor-like uncharacterized protein
MLIFNRFLDICQRFTVAWIGFIALASPITAPSQAKQPLDPFVAAGFEDAGLNGLCFSSSDRVWAVGDRGAIWATGDGGRNWTRQESGTTANLYAVAFKNSTEGCAVGGLPGALAHTSRGVILRTVNGGETWHAQPSEGIPRFTGMRMVGGRLIAWGDYCPQRKTGIFYSLDDGQSWQAMPSSIVHVAGLGSDISGNILAVDRVGNAFHSQLGPQRSSYTTSPNQPIEFVERAGSSWLAGGAEGQLLRTVDGQAWSRVALPLSPAAQRVCHWRTAVQFEDQIWIAGTPGSIVLHSADRGVTWQVLETEQTLPLRGVVFADAQRGWAVGAMGLILATRDGGRSWYPQRRTAARVGLLTVTATDAQVPWPVLVATSWDELVASSSLSLFAENLEQSADYRVENWKLHEALAPQLGLVEHQAWLYPKPTAASPTDIAQLIERLTVELQCFRPDVVLTDETGGPKLAAANRAAMVALTAAIQKAATESPQSVSLELRLPVWQVTKLATVTEAHSSQYSEHPNRLMREQGLSIWDVLLPTGASYDANAASVSMRTIQQNQSSLANNASLLGGIAPSQASRRQVTTRSLGNYQLIMGRVHRMTSLDNLATVSPETPLVEWQSQLDFVARGLPPRELAPSLLRIAQACTAPPLWSRRQLALERLVQLQPDSDTASHARLALLQMLSSDEMRAWKQASLSELSSSSPISELASMPKGLNLNASSLTPFDTIAASSAAALDTQAGSPVANGIALADPPPVTSAAFSSTSNSEVVSAAATRIADDKRSEPFFAALDACYKVDSYLTKVPQLELMREASLRSRSEAHRTAPNSMASLEPIAGLSALAGWPQAAQQEILLAGGRPEQLRWIAFAIATANRPRLDGLLDEPMWAASPPMQLMPSRQAATVAAETLATRPATVRWAFDETYLYIAVDSPREPQSHAHRAQRLRKYDSDLRASDHVHLMLDTDRDYASAIELAVSSAGETFDRCCGLTGFNPQYAVAVPESPQPERWTAEIAIRLSDLTTQTSLIGRAWAISAHRLPVNGENESWSSMLTEQVAPQSAGLLLFVPAPSR